VDFCSRRRGERTPIDPSELTPLHTQQHVEPSVRDCLIRDVIYERGGLLFTFLGLGALVSLCSCFWFWFELVNIFLWRRCDQLIVNVDLVGSRDN
jgi:hypothetical protein